MAKGVLMPKAGITVEECVITEWLKKVGDHVEVGDILFTYETDKASFECESTAAGTLLEIFYEEGDEVPCLVNVCAVGEPGEDVSALNAESQQMLALQKSETESTLLSLRRQFADMFKAQFKSLNDLCAAYLSPVKKDRKDKVYAAAMSQLDMIINDTDSHDKFMLQVNASLNGIMDKLRADLPNHDEHDFRFLAYVIVGFDAKTISSLTGYSVGTVYTKKNRLKKEISELKSVYKDNYLIFIS